MRSARWALLLLLNVSSVGAAQRLEPSCCRVSADESRQALSPQEQRVVRPGPKTHIALGALGGLLLSYGLWEAIEGHKQNDDPNFGVALGLFYGMIAGGVVGWIVYKIRQ